MKLEKQDGVHGGQRTLGWKGGGWWCPSKSSAFCSWNRVFSAKDCLCKYFGIAYYGALVSLRSASDLWPHTFKKMLANLSSTKGTKGRWCVYSSWDSSWWRWVFSLKKLSLRWCRNQGPRSLTPCDLPIQLPCYKAESSSSAFLPAQTAEFCALFDQSWRGGLSLLLSVNFGGAVSERPGIHNNLSFGWLMGHSDKGRLICLNGCTASSWGHAHSWDVWLQPDSLLNFLYSESPLLDLISWGRFEGCPCQGFFQTCRKGKMWFARKDFSKLSLQMINLPKSLLDPVTHPLPMHSCLIRRVLTSCLPFVIPQGLIKYLPQSFPIGPTTGFLWALWISCPSYWTTFTLILNFLLYLTLITTSTFLGLFPELLFSHNFLFFFIFISLHRSNSPEADFDMKSRVKVVYQDQHIWGRGHWCRYNDALGSLRLSVESVTYQSDHVKEKWAGLYSHLAQSKMLCSWEGHDLRQTCSLWWGRCWRSWLLDAV